MCFKDNMVNRPNFTPIRYSGGLGLLPWRGIPTRYYKTFIGSPIVIQMSSEAGVIEDEPSPLLGQQDIPMMVPSHPPTSDKAVLGQQFGHRHRFLIHV
jgi:hypothetical protein